MSLWRQITRGFRILLRRDAADRELAEELAHYAKEAEAARVAGGEAPDEARRRVRLDMGGALAVRETVRAGGWENAVFSTLADIRYAIRRCAAAPSATAVAVGTFAVGVGAATTIFSVVDPILLRPLPYPDAGRLIAVSDRTADGADLDVTFGTFREIVTRSRTLDAAAVAKPWQPTLSGGRQPERLDGQRVSARYLSMFGIGPAMGRDFDDADDRPGGPNVALISDRLWRRRFDADPSIVGRHVRLDAADFTVIGILPARFENVLAPEADALAPLQYDPSLPIDGREWGHHLTMIARLGHGVAIGAARRELDAIAHGQVAAFRRAPWASLTGGLAIRPLSDLVVGGARPALVAIALAVLLLLATACANVANLLLARGAQRAGELTMRIALGAGRVRLVRQLVTESITIALLGGMGALVVAEIGVRAFVASSPPGLPRVEAIRVDASTFVFAFAVSALVGILVGLAPARQAWRSDVRTAPAGRHTVGRDRRLRDALVVAEIGFALVLLVVAGLLFRSFAKLLAVDPGFEPSHVLTLQVRVARQAPQDAATQRFFDAALDAVAQVGGVESAAWTSQLPLSGDFEKYGAQLEPGTTDDPAADHSVLRYAVTSRYREAMGLRLRRGRWLSDGDGDGAPPVAVVSESFVRHRLGGRDPIGFHVHVGRTDVPWSTIVGVVGDVKQRALEMDDGDAAYVAAAQSQPIDATRSLVVRTRSEPAAIASAVRRAIWAVDPEQAVVRVATLDALVALSTARRRSALLVFESFALAALVLAAIGIYGVLSATVAERLREIGVRLALGASPRDIASLVIGRGMVLTSAGVACGAVAAAGASRLVAALLFAVSPLDPPTYGGVAALLAAAACVASCAPTWRALRVDPAAMLRLD